MLCFAVQFELYVVYWVLSCRAFAAAAAGNGACGLKPHDVILQEHLHDVLPSILDGLADEAEGVRDAALAAGRTFVDLYAETALPLLLPAVEDGILNDNWRIRQSSVELLGQLLFKVSPSDSFFWTCSLHCGRAGWTAVHLGTLISFFDRKIHPA